MSLRLWLRRHWLSSISFLLLVLFITPIVYFVYGPLVSGPATFYYEFKSGQTIQSVATALQQQGYLYNRRAFLWLAQVYGKNNNLQAGYYAFAPGDSAWRILHKLAYGETETETVTIVDGWTADKLLQTLVTNPKLSHSPVLLSQEALCRSLGLSDMASLEGQFWPETYSISPGYSDLSLLKRAHQLMQEHLQVLWATRADDLPYHDPYDALIMASLIQSETASSAERYLVASVLINRLNDNMLLQVDPTVIYALRSNYDGHLTHQDLSIDSFYNTYRYKGLPPTPIALPGLDALLATLHPDKTDYLYFVARGDGLHAFSTTLNEHNAAVNFYLKKQGNYSAS